MKTLTKILGRTAIAAAALALMGGIAQAQKTKLTVYTALENDQLAPLKKAFETDNPTIEIAWVRDSTGVIAARVLAEKANPQADIIWGLALTNMIQFDKQGMLDVYTPVGADKLRPQFVPAAAAAKTWAGMDAYLSFVCYNSAEAKDKKLPVVKTWKDLTDPAFKGRIVMPNPASSGTGYLTIAAWLQTMGEDAGWKFMDALHANIGQYVHSGSAPCTLAGRGEFAVGIGLDMRGVSEKGKGAPLDLILPSDGLGWELEATGIVKGTKNLAAAKKLMDWSVSKAAMEIYAQTYAMVGLPGVESTAKGYPTKDVEKLMVKNDFGWMAANRDRVLAEWTKRYDAKSAPKK